MSPVLEFDEPTHVYTLDGDVVPGVTTVLAEAGILGPYDGIPARYMDHGRRIHHAICWDQKSGIDLDQVEPDVRVYVERFRRFAELVDLKSELVEKSLACPTYRYAGTLDLVGKLHSENWVLDFKRKTLEPGHAVQVAGGYAPLVERHYGDGRLFRCGVVTLGTELPKLHEVAPFDEMGNRDTFRAALALWQWKAAHGKGGNA